MTIIFHRCGRSLARRSAQSGQALIYVVAMLIAVSLVTAYSFNAYTISNQKTRLQNTVDAAVYSAATLEARELNFMAYTNRAMIANQVAIAQMVGLMSWIRFMDRTLENLSLITSWIPGVNGITKAISKAMDAIRDVAEPALAGVITGIRWVNWGIETSQLIFHGAVTVAIVEVVTAVTEKNDPDVDAITALNTVQFGFFLNEQNDFKQRYSPDVVRNNQRNDRYYEHFERMEEVRAITSASRDRFSANRTYRVLQIPLVVRLERAGSTDLTGRDRAHEYGVWMGMDTFSIHKPKFKLFSVSWREAVPIGWGAAITARDEEDQARLSQHDKDDDFGGAWRKNNMAAWLAAGEFQNQGRFGDAQYDGLQRHYLLKDSGLIQKGPGLRLLLTKPSDRIRTTQQMGFNSERMDLEEETTMPGEQVHAMGAAETYFARINDSAGPDRNLARSDGRREYGNLFNPYWHARLKGMSQTEKLALRAAAGLNLGG